MQRVNVESDSGESDGFPEDRVPHLPGQPLDAIDEEEATIIRDFADLIERRGPGVIDRLLTASVPINDFQRDGLQGGVVGIPGPPPRVRLESVDGVSDDLPGGGGRSLPDLALEMIAEEDASPIKNLVHDIRKGDFAAVERWVNENECQLGQAEQEHVDTISNYIPPRYEYSTLFLNQEFRKQHYASFVGIVFFYGLSTIMTFALGVPYAVFKSDYQFTSLGDCVGEFRNRVFSDGMLEDCCNDLVNGSHYINDLSVGGYYSRCSLYKSFYMGSSRDHICGEPVYGFVLSENLCADDLWQYGDSGLMPSPKLEQCEEDFCNIAIERADNIGIALAVFSVPLLVAVVAPILYFFYQYKKAEENRKIRELFHFILQEIKINNRAVEMPGKFVFLEEELLEEYARKGWLRRVEDLIVRKIRESLPVTQAQVDKIVKLIPQKPDYDRMVGCWQSDEEEWKNQCTFLFYLAFLTIMTMAFGIAYSIYRNDYEFTSLDNCIDEFNDRLFGDGMADRCCSILLNNSDDRDHLCVGSSDKCGTPGRVDCMLYSSFSLSTSICNETAGGFTNDVNLCDSGYFVNNGSGLFAAPYLDQCGAEFCNDAVDYTLNIRIALIFFGSMMLVHGLVFFAANFLYPYAEVERARWKRGKFRSILDGMKSTNPTVTLPRNMPSLSEPSCFG